MLLPSHLRNKEPCLVILTHQAGC
uniref:Uncharacterized protein n=1 Tax=Anguilla anguilla TaxID=7936 RepID=A0A0E9SEX8_ANGAN